MNDIFLHPTVSKAAVNAFFKRNAISGGVHSVHLLHHGETVLRIAIPPYCADDKRESYSLSKSFASTAIGILVTEGKLSTEDRIVDIFPDKCPDVISDKLAAMKLRHVLSMNTGHPSCVMEPVSNSDDAVRTFLEQEVVFEPGTHFAYNTGATCLLACIVEKITGMKLLDFLTAKLLLPMGIQNVSWLDVKSKHCQGGCGIHVSCDDIVKLGQLYLNGGVYGGKRYLSEEWVNEATSKISDNTDNGTADWCVGYGFQFWRNAKCGYRGDGAFGQLCMVFPEYDMVVAVQGLLGDMWGEVESVYDLIDNLYNESDEELDLPVLEPASSDLPTSGLENIYYVLDENVSGLTGLYLTVTDKTLCINLSDGEYTELVRAGNGKWEDSTIFLRRLKPNLPSLQDTDRRHRTEMSSSYSAEDGKITVSVRFRNSPHPMTWTFAGDGDNIKLNIEESGFMAKGADSFTGKKFNG